MPDLKHLDRLNELPLKYFEGRAEQRSGLRFEQRAGESDEDRDARYCGHCDVESCISPLERIEAEEKGESV